MPGCSSYVAAASGVPLGALYIGNKLHIISASATNRPLCEIPATKASATWRGMAWSVDSTTLFAIDTTNTLHAFDARGNTLCTWRVGGKGVAGGVAAWGTCVYVACSRVLVVVDAAGGGATGQGGGVLRVQVCRCTFHGQWCKKHCLGVSCAYVPYTCCMQHHTRPV